METYGDFTALMCVTVAWGNVALAESSEESVQNVSTEEQTNMSGPISSEESSEVMPLDITVGDGTWYVLQKAATAYLAPYGTGCAPAGKSFSAGQGVYVVSRDYEYYYVYWYDSNGKEMFAYLPMSAFGTVNYIWTEYDIYEKATCTATTEVVAYAGTTNTYAHVGWIYAGESPLMVLGQRVNPYNNVTYYFVQYETDAGLAKRGWVDASLGTVQLAKTRCADELNDGDYFSLLNHTTKQALTWNRTTNNVELQPFSANLNQTFYFEKTLVTGGKTNYYRIVSAADSSKVLTISGYGYAENSNLCMRSRGGIDKRQEFKIHLVTHSNEITPYYFFSLYSRSTGNNRIVRANGTATSGTSVVQSYFAGDSISESNMVWRLAKIQAPWDGAYGVDEAGSEPSNYKVYIDPSIADECTLALVTDCLNEWNNARDNYSLQAIVGTCDAVSRNDILAIIKPGEFCTDASGWTTYGTTTPMEVKNGNLVAVEDYYPNNDPLFYVSKYDENWHTTEILINTVVFGDEDTDELKMTLTHEFGHALKLSHTYCTVGKTYNQTTSSYKWFENTEEITVMDQGWRADWQITQMDEDRLNYKWDNWVY